MLKRERKIDRITWRKGRKYPHPVCRPSLPSGPNLFLSFFFLFPARSRFLTLHTTCTDDVAAVRFLNYVHIHLPQLHRQMHCAGPKCSFPGVMNGKSDFIYSEIGEGVSSTVLRRNGFPRSVQNWFCFEND